MLKRSRRSSREKTRSEVSGQALAGLTREQLQSKLDWLVRMRIVEASANNWVAGVEDRGTSDEPPVHSASKSGGSLRSTPATRILYSIHPAVRDGFLSGISGEAAVAGHEAVRKGSGSLSRRQPPVRIRPIPPRSTCWKRSSTTRSSPATSAKPTTSTENRIGGYKNLGWRLGAYERGERICRAFAGGQSPETVAFRLRESSTSSDATFAERKLDESHAPGCRRRETLGNAAPARCGGCLFSTCPKPRSRSSSTSGRCICSELGRLAAAARCYELGLEMDIRQEDWKRRVAQQPEPVRRVAAERPLEPLATG